MKAKVELLDSNKKENALSFYREALNIEFTQIIGKMDINCSINSKRHDKILVKMGICFHLPDFSQTQFFYGKDPKPDSQCLR